MLCAHACLPTVTPPRRTQTRKDVAAVFSGLLRTSVDGKQPCVAYVQENVELLVTLTKGYVRHTPARTARQRAPERVC